MRIREKLLESVATVAAVLVTGRKGRCEKMNGGGGREMRKMK